MWREIERERPQRLHIRLVFTSFGQCWWSAEFVGKTWKNLSNVQQFAHVHLVRKHLKWSRVFLHMSMLPTLSIKEMKLRLKARSSIHFMTWYFPIMPSFHSSWLLQTRVCVGAVGKRKRTLLTGVSDQNRGQLFNFPPTFDLTHQLTIVWPNRHQATKGNCICSCGPTSIQPSPVSPSPWSQITVAVCRPGASLE